MARKVAGTVLVVLGVAMMVAAALLFAHNRLEDANAGAQASELLGQAHAAIDAGNTSAADAGASPDGSEDAPSTPLPTAEVGGYPCVGVLQIPDLDLELPVLDDWDYERLTVAPCRQSGSPQTDDLVIAGHNYASHFGTLKDLQVGARVMFVAMDGEVFSYTVVAVTTVDPYDVAQVKDSPYDLVLYTCTYGGASRVLVGCDRVSA